jgi:hypothetical protein
MLLAHMLVNSAADFGERERTTIFSVVLRRFFAREKNWSWSFALNFVSFVQAKEIIKQKNLFTNHRFFRYKNSHTFRIRLLFIISLHLWTSFEDCITISL